MTSQELNELIKTQDALKHLLTRMLLLREERRTLNKLLEATKAELQRIQDNNLIITN